MEDELPGVLDGVDEPPTVEELEAVVRRAGQRRRATLVAGGAGLLAVGALAGALARGPGEDTTGFAATDVPTTRPPMYGPMQSGMSVGISGPLTPLFRRDANGVAVRAYRTSWTSDPVARANCPPPDVVQGELSNSAAVGVAMSPLVEGDTFALLGVGRFGDAEGEPVTWATVRAGAGVSTVRLRLGDAVDGMAPHEGLAVLAVPGTATDGVVEGVDAAGKVVATRPLSQPPDALPQPDPACVPAPCVTHSGSGSTAAQPTPAPATDPGQPPATLADLPHPPPARPGDVAASPAPERVDVCPVPVPMPSRPSDTMSPFLRPPPQTVPPAPPPQRPGTTTVSARAAGPVTTLAPATTVAAPTTTDTAP